MGIVHRITEGDAIRYFFCSPARENGKNFYLIIRDVIFIIAHDL